MSPAGTFDENDLQAMAAPALQRALLKVPDDLLAQALSRAPAAVAARVLENLSARRSAAIGRTSRRMLDSGELGPAAARTALRNLVRRIFEIAGPEAEGRTASRSVAPARAAADAGVPAVRRENEAEPQPGPDLTPGAFARLRELRAAFDSACRISPYVKGLECAKQGANAAVLVRTWLRRARFS
jgi:hypothetical protein